LHAPLGVWQLATPAEHATAHAAVGATREETIGNATTAAKPIFLIASRLVCPLKLTFSSAANKLFSLNWSIASQIKFSCTAVPD
jgi:hypothetical protein